MASPPRFMDLLRQLADEHHREVEKLSSEVARLQQVCDEMTFKNTSGNQQPLQRDSTGDDTPDEQALTAAFFVAKEVHKAHKQGKPEKDALEAALVLASPRGNGSPSDAFALQEVDDYIPADGEPCKVTVSDLSPSAHRSKPLSTRFETPIDGEQSTGIGSAAPERVQSSQKSSFLMMQPSASFIKPIPLSGWGTLIKAVKAKHYSAALPGLNTIWADLMDAQDGPALGRQGMFQLDMLVARATHLNLGAVEDFGRQASTKHMFKLCAADGWLCRTWRRTVMHPTSVRRVCWDICGIVLLVHDLVFIPMTVFETGTNGMPTEYGNFMNGLDVVSASFWSIDIGVSFRTGFYSAEGFVELRPWPVAQNYMKSWLPMDLIIVCTDWCTMFLGMSGAAGFMRLGKSISRFMRVVRLLRFLKMNRALKELTERINSEYVLQVMGLMKTLLFIVLINHYIACGWYGLGCMGLISAWPDKFLVNYPDSFSYAYTTSLHWSLTQFTPASMEVVPQNPVERFFVIGVIIVALVAFSSFVSSITAAMTHIRQINAQKMQLEAKIRQFFSEHKISHAMASRVWHFLKRNRVGTIKRLKENDIAAFKMLPERIKEDLRLEIYLPTLAVHPLFAEYSKREQMAMLQICNIALEERSMAVGEELWRDVEEVQDMLFVVYGSLIYHEQATRLDLGDEVENPVEVTVGQWACEICLWANKAILPGVFMALTGGCEFVLLNADSFQKIVSNSGGSIPFLVKYATAFMDGFQTASTECHTNDYWNESDILFNSYSRADDYVHVADGRRKSVPFKSGRKTNFSGFSGFYSVDSRAMDASDSRASAQSMRSSVEASSTL